MDAPTEHNEHEHAQLPIAKVSAKDRTQLLTALDSAIKSERMRQAYRIVLEHRPITGMDCNEIHRRATNKDQAIHTYLDKLATAGWLQRVGKGFSEVTGKPGDLWDVTGVVGERISNYKHRQARRQASAKGIAHGGDTVRVTRNIWLDITTALKDYLGPKLTGGADWMVTLLDQSIDEEIDAVRERLMARVNKLVESADVTPSRREFLASCEDLGVPPPAVGKPFNLVAARRKYHRLAREYHPDVNPGNEVQFRRAKQAFETIELYVHHKMKAH